jgi:hypothetical protein
MLKPSGKIILLIPVVVVVAGLGMLYLFTCPRDISWEHHAQDTGDLIACAHILGIPHPTGYPLFIMVGHLFTRLEFGAFASHPIYWNNAAFKLTLFVILTSLANLYLFWRIHVLLQKKLGMRIAGTFAGSAAAAAGALALGTSLLYWSQSIVPEVYLLNLFFIDLTLLAVLSLTSDDESLPSPRSWGILGLVMGLGLFHHMSYGLFLPGFLILAICCFKRPKAKMVAFLIGGMLISLLPLLYLPIRSAQDPAIDTSNPETLSNFWHHITARAYRSYLFKCPVGDMFRYLKPFDLGEQFGNAGATLACIGIIGCYLRRTRLSIALLAFCLLSTGLVLLHVGNYYVLDRVVFFLPAFFAMAHLMALGISFVIDFAAERSESLKPAWRWIIFIILIIGGIAWQASSIHHAFDWNIDASGNYTAKAYGSQAFAELEKDAIIFTWYDGPSYSLLYHKHVLFRGIRDDVDIVFVSQIQATWWWENVADGHPDVELSIQYTPDRNEIVADIIRTNIDKRPIYTAWPRIPIPKDFRIIHQGRLFKIISVADYERRKNYYHEMEGVDTGAAEESTTPAPHNMDEKSP